MAHRTVIWEINRESALPCVHCQTVNDPKFAHELSTYEAYKTVDEILSVDPRTFIIAGGDPLGRSDIFQVIDYARRRGMRPLVEVVATSNLTEAAIEHLQQSGAAGMIFSINGASSYRHDVVTALRGSFSLTISALEWARAIGLPVHVTTLLNRRNVSHLGSIADLLSEHGVKSWTVHFEIPSGPARMDEMLDGPEAERTYATLATLQESMPFRIRTMEAPGYRRYLIQNSDEKERWPDFANFLPDEISDATVDDVVFIAHNGAVRPSAFLPMNGGNVRYKPLRAILVASDLFAAVGDRSKLTGKCGRCEYCQVCGGSRARSWALTGLLLGPDPMCIHQPRRVAEEASP
jgi:AdoMet-dependent heme synthase